LTEKDLKEIEDIAQSELSDVQGETILALVAEVRRLREVLGVYADRGNWCVSDESSSYCDALLGLGHGWDIAEEALKDE
jgi:hypothetical protein